jgi:hypothetical protein
MPRASKVERQARALCVKLARVLFVVPRWSGGAHGEGLEEALADERLQLLAKLCCFLGVTYSGRLLQNQSLTGGG